MQDKKSLKPNRFAKIAPRHSDLGYSEVFKLCRYVSGNV
ncbi:hypothetical protein OSCI_3650019 [Kamptonema sp. PCC 6506]|nr:hypothetical protein OSCI_3650019 [Kamptonema sp. PCC 6506]